MNEANDFLDKLHRQTSEMAAPKEKKDKTIMKVLGSWSRKDTDEYRSFALKEKAGIIPSSLLRSLLDTLDEHDLHPFPLPER